jgi:hypothetical protein
VADAYGNSVNVLLGNRKTATHLQITAPASVTAGTPFTITVSALAAGNGVDDLYTGTVTFTSSDGSAVLPGNYTFTKRDLGLHTFTVTLKTSNPAQQTITATDTVTSTITGTATVTVNHAGPPPGRGGRASGMAAGTGSVPATDDLAALLAEAGFLVGDWAPRFSSGNAMAAENAPIAVSAPARITAPASVPFAMAGTASQVGTLALGRSSVRDGRTLMEVESFSTFPPVAGNDLSRES